MFFGNSDELPDRDLSAGLLDAAFLKELEDGINDGTSRSAKSTPLSTPSQRMTTGFDLDILNDMSPKLQDDHRAVNFTSESPTRSTNSIQAQSHQQLVATWKTSCGQFVDIFPSFGMPLCAKFSTGERKPLPPARPILTEGGIIKMMGAVVTSLSDDNVIWSDGDVWKRHREESNLSFSNTSRTSLNEMMDRTFGNLAMLEPVHPMTFVASDAEQEENPFETNSQHVWEAPPTIQRDTALEKSCFARMLEALKGCCGISKSLDTYQIRDLNPEHTLLIDTPQLEMCVKKARNVLQTTTKTCNTKHCAQQLAATLCLALDTYCPGYAAGHRFDLLLAACPEDSNIMYSVLRQFAAEHRNRCPSVQGFKKSKVKIVELWWSVDADCSGTLDLEEIISLMEVLNAKVPKSRIKQTFTQFDEDCNGSLDFFEFIEMYQFMLRRMELRVVYKTYFTKPRESNKEHTTYDSLRNFFSTEQKQPEPTLTELRGLVNDWSQSDEYEVGWLDLQSFTQYVLSTENTWWDPAKSVTYQDMNRPLSHYYIYSSHNTYLVGNQVGDGSSTRMYRFALRQGIRCVEIDCHDSKDNPPIPVVTHGGAMCSVVTFEDVIKTIVVHAFSTSPYPVIISLENHCSASVQLQMVDIIKEHLSDYIGPSFNDMTCTDPSFTPNALKRKILLRGKTKVTIPQLQQYV